MEATKEPKADKLFLSENQPTIHRAMKDDQFLELLDYAEQNDLLPENRNEQLYFTDETEEHNFLMAYRLKEAMAARAEKKHTKAPRTNLIIPTLENKYLILGTNS